MGYEFSTYGDYKCSKIWSEDVKRRNVENFSLGEKIGCENTGSQVLDWIHMAEDRDRLRAVARFAMCLQNAFSLRNLFFS